MNFAATLQKANPAPEYSRANNFFLVVLWACFVASLILAPWHGTWTQALLFGLPAAIVPTLLVLSLPGALSTRLCIGAALMVFCGLHIHQAGGMIEVHFGIFAMLALLVIYEDWRVIVVAAAVIAVHHVGATYMQASGYGMICMPSPSMGLVVVHAGYVVIESIALSYLAVAMRNRTLGAARDKADIEANLHSMRNVATHTRLGVDAIQTASLELNTSSNSIAEGAQIQAASLQETSASLELITASLRLTADNARQATLLATASKNQADEGRLAVSHAVVAMGEINTASSRIFDIISTVDEITFQTNLLAVNAAVEAAHAGEQGRGFAVVASETRSLAQRSAGASQEIKRLIQDTLSKVERGAVLVNKSGESLQAIVNSVRRVSDIVSEIAAATEEQSSGIEQINTAVMQIDHVTQSNSAQTEELSATAQVLSEQATHLMELTGDLDLNSSQPEQQRPTLQGAPAARPITIPMPVQRLKAAVRPLVKTVRTKLAEKSPLAPKSGPVARGTKRPKRLTPVVTIPIPILPVLSDPIFKET